MVWSLTCDLRIVIQGVQAPENMNQKAWWFSWHFPSWEGCTYIKMETINPFGIADGFYRSSQNRRTLHSLRGPGRHVEGDLCTAYPITSCHLFFQHDWHSEAVVSKWGFVSMKGLLRICLTLRFSLSDPKDNRFCCSYSRQLQSKLGCWPHRTELYFRPHD